MAGIDYDEWDWSGFGSDDGDAFADDDERFVYDFMGYSYVDEMDRRRDYAPIRYEEEEEDVEEEDEEDEEMEEEDEVMEEMQNLCDEIEELNLKIRELSRECAEKKQRLSELMQRNNTEELSTEFYNFQMKREMKVEVPRRYSDMVYDLLRTYELDCRKDDSQRRKLAIEILYGENGNSLPEPLARMVKTEIVSQLSVTKK